MWEIFRTTICKVIVHLSIMRALNQRDCSTIFESRYGKRIRIGKLSYIRAIPLKRQNTCVIWAIIWSSLLMTFTSGNDLQFWLQIRRFKLHRFVLSIFSAEEIAPLMILRPVHDLWGCDLWLRTHTCVTCFLSSHDYRQVDDTQSAQSARPVHCKDKMYLRELDIESIYCVSCESHKLVAC